MGHLKSLKNYFLLERSDFFVHFLDSAEDELKQKIKLVSKEKLESLLEMSIRTSTLSNDPYIDDFSCRLSKYTLKESLVAMINSNTSMK